MKKHIYPRGKVWNYRFEVGGVSYRGKIGEVSESVAHSIAEKKRLDAIAGKLIERPAESPKLGRYDETTGEFTDTVAEFLKQCAHYQPGTLYLTRLVMRQFCTFAGNKKLAEIAPFTIERYKQDRKKAGASDGTLLRELGILTRFFNIAIKFEWTATNPVKRVEKPEQPGGRERWLEEAEELPLVAELEHNVKMWAFTILAVETGLRPGELQKLRWRDIDIGAASLSVLSSYSRKNPDSRTAGLSARAIGALQKWKAESGPASNGDFVFGPYSYRKNFERARDKVGLGKDVVFYSLRHSFGSRLGNENVNSLLIGALMGHRQARMTTRYVHVSEQGRRLAVATLEARRNRQTNPTQKPSQAKEAVAEKIAVNS